MVWFSVSMVTSWYISRASSRSIRSLSCSVLSICRLLAALAQAVAERDAFIEHEARAVPTAVGFRDFLEISEDAALEVIDLGKAAREQVRARLLAADAAGAEHRDPAMPGRIEPPRGELLELAEARDAGIEGALETAQRHLEGVAGIEQQNVGGGDQRIPLRRI